MKKNLLGPITTAIGGSALAFTLIFSGCATQQSKRQLKAELMELVKEDPSIIQAAIENHPVAIMNSLQKAVKVAQQEEVKKKREKDAKSMEERFENPLRPKISADRILRGAKNAPIVLVEYSDFECPFCAKGGKVVDELMKKYKGKVKVIYKHLPLDFHPNAEISARYFEAIAMQSATKAWKFHDLIFQTQGKLRKGGERHLKSLAKQLKVDMKKLKKDLSNPKITKRINEDKAEAAKFGIQGTPGFIINGIPVKGAYPVGHFENIITKLQEKGKLKL